MEEDDDLFVVIIGDQKGDGGNVSIQEIKTEYIPSEDLRQQIFEHGEVIESTELLNVKTEIEDCLEDYENYEELQDMNDSYNKFLDEDSQSNEQYFDEDFNPQDQLLDDDSNTFEEVPLYCNKDEETNSGTQSSLVESLREEYPDWDEGELIIAIKTFMDNVKIPQLPDVYYTKDKKSRFVCVVCNKTTESLNAAGRHYEERHGPRYRICFACGASFRSRTNLYKHEKRCSSRHARVVLRARELYLARGEKQRPYMQKDNPLRNENHRYVCNMCPADFLTKVQLQAHENLHLGLRPFACEQCPAAYTSAAGLKKHMIKHLDIQFVCDHCGRSFKKKDCLITHLNTHLPMKKFGCDACSKRYATKAALQLHARREHLRLPPPCACRVCNKRFNRMSTLKDHMKSKHQMDLITRHMFLKMQSRGEIAAPAHLVLKQDLPSPTDETPLPPSPPKPVRPRLQCDHCEKTYVSKQDLRHHELSAHLNVDTRHTCDLCQKTYSRLAVLRKHLRSAHGAIMMSRKKFLKSLPKLIEMNTEILTVGGSQLPANVQAAVTDISSADSQF